MQSLKPDEAAAIAEANAKVSALGYVVDVKKTLASGWITYRKKDTRDAVVST